MYESIPLNKVRFREMETSEKPNAKFYFPYLLSPNWFSEHLENSLEKFNYVVVTIPKEDMPDESFNIPSVEDVRMDREF